MSIRAVPWIVRLSGTVAVRLTVFCVVQNALTFTEVVPVAFRAPASLRVPLRLRPELSLSVTLPPLWVTFATCVLPWLGTMFAQVDEIRIVLTVYCPPNGGPSE